MSIVIKNVSGDDWVVSGTNTYQVSIGSELICTYTHTRSVAGLSRCLRDAADAVDAARHTKEDSLTASILEELGNTDIWQK